MRLNRIKKVLVGALVAVILLLGAGTTSSNAQVRVFVRPRVFAGPRFFPYYSNYPYPYYAQDPIAYQKEAGYSDGLSRGRSDGKHGQAFAPDSHSHYRDSKSLAYREAFLQGYRDGYGQPANG